MDLPPSSRQPLFKSWEMPALGALLFVLTLFTFWPAIHNGFVLYDDPQYIWENGYVQGGLSWQGFRWAFSTSDAANWHPITWISHMLDSELFGIQPWGHHLTSVLLHATNGLLVFLLFKRLTGSISKSWIIAALFAIHPLRVESVAWVAERKDVLSMFFGLLALLLYARYAQKLSRVESRESRARPADFGAFDSRHSTLDYLLSFLFFILALMSKPMLVTLPFILLLLDFWPLNRWRGKDWKFNAGLFAEKLPFFFASFADSIVTIFVQSHTGAVVSSLNLPERIANALVSYCRYMGKLIWPANLAVFYPHPAHWGAIIVGSALVIVVGMSVAALAWNRKFPWLPVGWFWFLGTLVPVIGLVQAGEQSMADRYSYLPSLGLLLLAVWGLARLTPEVFWKSAGAILIALVLLAGMWQTRRQIASWKNSEILFRHAIAVTHENYLAHNGLGTALGQQGRLDEAVDEFKEALKEKPGYFFAHANLGTTLQKQGKLTQALGELQEAIRESPSYYAGHCKLGAVLENLGQLGAASAEFRKAIELKPDYADAHVDLGIVLSKQNDPAGAILQFQEALRDNPRSSAAHYAWGTVLDRQGQTGGAIAHYGAAVALDDGNADAHFNLGSLLARTGHLDDAIRELRRANELRPDAEAYNDLGVMLERKGLTGQAIAAYAMAVQLQPGDARAHFNRGLALCKLGGLDAGIEEFKEALRLKPDYAEAKRGLDLALSVRQSLQKNDSKP